MPGIEDFVVEQIMQDFQQQQAPQAPAVQSPQSSFTGDAQYAGNFKQMGLPAGATSDPRAPQGFTFQNPADAEKYTQYSGNLDARAATGAGIENAMRERDQQRFKVLEGLKGLDPQIQATILKRLGIDPGAVKSQLDQQKELAKYKQDLEQPQNDVANAIKMMLATQGGQQNAAELAMKQQAHEAQQASHGQTQNIQLMRVLASLMQSDVTGQLQKSIGPLLLQMLQGSGINLTPPAATNSKQPAKNGRTITRE